MHAVWRVFERKPEESACNAIAWSLKNPQLMIYFLSRDLSDMESTRLKLLGQINADDICGVDGRFADEAIAPFRYFLIVLAGGSGNHLRAFLVYLPQIIEKSLMSRQDSHL